MTDSSAALQDYARSLLPVGGLEAAEPPEKFVDSAIAWADRGLKDRPNAAKREAALQCYTALTDPREVLVPVDTGALEAIILPGLRPVGDIDGDKFVLPDAGEFVDYVNDANIKERLERAIASVGCIVLPGHPSLPYAGTGVVVGDDLVMTNRHVAQIFCSGLGTKGLSFVSDYRTAIDPHRETESAGGQPKTFPVAEVVMIHPYWDMALLRVRGLEMPKVKLVPIDPAGGRRRIAVVGYPAFDPRSPTDVQMNVFHSHFNVKRIAPGYLNNVSSIPSFENTVAAATHDASTLGGNSGSAVIDVDTGYVIALHFAGLYQKTNYAVPAAALARDARVVDLGVSFTETHPDPNLPWDDRWRAVEGGPAAGTGVGPGPSGPASHELVLSASRTSLALQASARSDGTTLRVTIPIEISIGVGGLSVAAPADAPVAPLGSDPLGAPRRVQ
jgi:endonuclease G